MLPAIQATSPSVKSGRMFVAKLRAAALALAGGLEDAIFVDIAPDTTFKLALRAALTRATTSASNSLTSWCDWFRNTIRVPTVSGPISGPLDGTGAKCTISSGLIATGDPSGLVNCTSDTAPSLFNSSIQKRIIYSLL